MPIRSTPPPTPVKASSEKVARDLERARVRKMYKGLLAFLFILHFLATILLSADGFMGYLRSWKNLFQLLLAQPALAPVVPLALVVLYKGVELWRDSEPKEFALPPFPPVPDLRFTNDILIGSAWTRKGKQPGELFRPDEDDDELFAAEDVHVILNEKGLFGNIQVTGGVGSGKTSSLIQPFIWQGISKFPRPPHPNEVAIGPDGRYPLAEHPTATLRGRVGGLFKSNETDKAFSIPPELRWQPYAGMTCEEAEQEYERLLELHEKHKWGMFIMDPKGDLTEFVLRAAAACGRAEDVIVLRPDGESTYNPLVINANPGVQAELVMDGIEAVSGQPIQQYWRGTMAEWLENALALLRVVDPTRMTFKSVLRLARNESLRTHMVSEAESIMRRAQEEEERLRRLGREYTGIRVDPAVVEFFRDWDDEEADPQLKRAVVSGIKTQSKFFVNSELAPFLCPEMPPTFNGFEHMIDKGQIVVLRMPLDIYGPVARVLGILVMADAQQAARARINRKDINQERVIAFCVDEISAYLNESTKDFIAMNRQSRVCFLAAHQTQAQLTRRGDPGFQDAFKDNLRTKICFNTPNADAARKDASLMGSRHVYKQSITESTTFHRVERVEKDVIAPVSPEGASMSIRIDEVDRLWFAPEEFMKLRTAECIVAEFDGETTRPPRKLKAQQFYQTPWQPLLDAEDVDHRIRPAHPVVRIGTNPNDVEYLGAALLQTGYVIIEPLANAAQELEGFKFITDVGTVIASADLIEELEHAAEERLTDQQILVLFTDFNTCASFFAHSLGFQFERVLSIVDAFRDTNGSIKADTFPELYREQTGEALPYSLAGSWEYHTHLEENHDTLLQTSRRVLKLFRSLGDRLAEIGDNVLEEMYEATRQRIAAFVTALNTEQEDDTAAHADEQTYKNEAEHDLSSLNEPISDSSVLEHTPDDPEAFFSNVEDPFAGDRFPDELETPEPALPAGRAAQREDKPLTPEPGPGATPPTEPTQKTTGLKRARRDRSKTATSLPLFRSIPKDEEPLEQEVDFQSLEFPADFDMALRMPPEDVTESVEEEPMPSIRSRKASRRSRRTNDAQRRLPLDEPEDLDLEDGAPLD